MAQINYEEKRSFTRMKVKTPVSFSIKSEPETSYHGQSQDLSATGLLMFTEVALEQGDEIDITLETNDERLPPFTAQGIVCRVKLTEEGHLVSVDLTQTS